MKAIAKARYVRVTPQKARRVIDVVRGKNAVEALNILQFAPQRVAKDIRKVLASALANAEQAAQKTGASYADENMVVFEAMVDEGPTMKRMRARAKGTGARILKRTSHLTIVVADKEESHAPVKREKFVKMAEAKALKAKAQTEAKKAASKAEAPKAEAKAGAKKSTTKAASKSETKAPAKKAASGTSAKKTTKNKTEGSAE